MAGLVRMRERPWVGTAAVLAAFTVLAAGAAVLAGHLPGGDDGVPGLAVRAGAGVVVAAIVLWAGSRFLGRGPATARAGFAVAAPALVWFAAITLIAGAALLSGSAELDRAALGSAAVAALTVAPLLVLAAALPEELVFRGYVQHVLGRHLAPMSTIAAQAALFAVCTGLVTRSAAGLTGAFLTGVFLGYLRQFTGDLWGVLGLRVAMTVSTVFLGAAGFAFTRAPAAWNLALGVGAALCVLLVAVLLHRRNPRPVSEPGDAAPRPRTGLNQKGILYDVGSSYLPGQHSRARWRPDVVREELRVIREDLHCTAVCLFGESPQRLEEAARAALDLGLYVWLQPRRFDAPVPRVLDNLAEVAGIAQRLREEHPDRVGLNVGCEISLLHRGVLPGGLGARTVGLAVVSAIFPPYLGRRTNQVLRRMVAVAGERFDGPLTYGAGTWESVDWRPFDVVGVNHYTDVMTRSGYRQGLRRAASHGKPVLVTEFGCCSYDGAQAKGGSGADIMDWRDLDDRRITGTHVRDEQVQADHIEYQLDVFETEDVDGAFLCMFIEGDCRWSPDPTRDLDMASFGIVRPPSRESGLDADDGHWEPKAAFHALARRYGADVPAGSR
ncbi:CPBP family glutamic-type intramembrane protease [Pseudonocardia sp. NPDC046786]|uniref:CPBP family glutamic-type intramembrane protease n=1 Tax=Pseudonocardia sp. NPDC046786 TaxID=3155471 RepID=UPI0033D5C1BF